MLFVCAGTSVTMAEGLKKDTVIEKSLYKLSKKEFYAKYAKGDKEKEQLIDHYFYRRKQAIRKSTAFPIAFVFAGVMIGTSVTTKNTYVQSTTFYGGIFGIVGSLIGIPVSLDGLKTAKKYNRKTLYLLLSDIDAGKKTSKDVLDNIIRYEVIEDDE